MDPRYSLVVVAALVLNRVLLAVASLTALFSRLPSRRRVALELVHLMLVPAWRRGPRGRVGEPVLRARAASRTGESTERELNGR